MALEKDGSQSTERRPSSLVARCFYGMDDDDDDALEWNGIIWPDRANVPSGC